MTDYTIILADDHTLLREGIRNMIDSASGLKVIGEAGDGQELLSLMKNINSDLVILDISMPGLRGIEAAREIRNQYPQTKVLMLSMHKNEEFLAMALEAGASGFLLKEDSGDQLLKAIDEIRRGRTYLSASLAKCLSSDIIGICQGKKKATTRQLTHRERQVLKLIAEGFTDRQIGEMLYISLRTVQRHRYNIRTKLNLKRTADLVKYAIAKGYTNG